MIVKIREGVTVDTDACTFAELKEAKDAIDTDVLMILAQIEKAKAHHLSTGEYADPHWFAKANHALRVKRRTQQKLQELLRIHHKAENVQNQPLSQFFMDVCRERMDAALFDLVLQEAIYRKRTARDKYIEERQP
jgi:hypothetical protein